MTPMEFEERDYLTGLREIDEHPWSKGVAKVVAGENPRGEPIDDDERFEELDSEMMKRGTLAHAKIRWDWIGDQSSQLMAERSKDYRLLSFMVQSMAQSPASETALVLGVALFARFTHLWRDSAFPEGKGRIAPIRLAIDALEALVARAADQPLDAARRLIVVTALRETSGLIAEVSPDLGVRLAVLPSRVETVRTEPEPGHVPADQTASPPPEPTPATVTTPLRADTLRLDAGNERALKQSLSVVADYLLGVDVRHPLSYRIRRYATWFGISSPPPSKSGKRTVIQPVSEDSADAYKVAAERGHEGLDIVQKLERSCLIQPFWIEGQHIAYRLASACGRNLVAEAIRMETSQFVESFDWMTELQFSDGSSFVPKEVRGWLAGRRSNVDAGPALAHKDGNANETVLESSLVDQEMKAAIMTAREQARQGQMGAALSLMDRMRASLREPRACAIWEVLVMECLSDWGMKAHVSMQAERLRQSIEGQAVREWEPELMERIGRLQIEKRR